MNKREQIAVFAETHKAIEETADSVIEILFSNIEPNLTYPPNSEFSAREKELLSEIKLNPDLAPLLQKLIVDACSYPIFHTLCVLDGVADPEVIEIDEWHGGTLGGSEDEMIHDEFYESYSEYHNAQKGR